MEIEISDDCVVLSDFENWSVILLHGLLADSEEEYERLENEYNGLPEKNKKAFVDKNWERVFDLTPLDNDWIRRGATIQATFWELRKENIREVRIFTSGTAA